MVSSLNITFYNETQFEYDNNKTASWDALNMEAKFTDSNHDLVVNFGGVSRGYGRTAVNVSSSPTNVAAWKSAAEAIGRQIWPNDASSTDVSQLIKSVLSNVVGLPFLTFLAISPTQNNQCSKSGLGDVISTVPFITTLMDNNKPIYNPRG